MKKGKGAGGADVDQAATFRINGSRDETWSPDTPRSGKKRGIQGGG